MTIEKANRLHKILKGDLAAIVELQEIIAEISQNEYDKGFTDGESYGKTNERAR